MSRPGGGSGPRSSFGGRGARVASADPSLIRPDLGPVAARPSPPRAEDVAARAGTSVDAVARLAANENPLGPSERAIEAARAVLLSAHRYPDPDHLALRRALAAHHGVGEEQVALGNGSSEIIELLVRTFVGPGQTVVSPWPTFGAYRVAAQVAGRELLAAPLSRGRIDLAGVAALVDPRTKLVFLANPNNPTGTHVGLRALAAFLNRVPPETIVAIDEAYADFVDAPDYPRAITDLLPGHPRLVVLRTFSKAHGLAGLRAGYGVMAAALAVQLERVRPVYSLSAVAGAAALAALEDVEHVERTRRLVLRERARMVHGLERLGLEPYPSQTNFVCVRGLPLRTAEALERDGVMVRGLEAYGMSDALRITVGSPEANARALEALARWLDAAPAERPARAPSGEVLAP